MPSRKPFSAIRLLIWGGWAPRYRDIRRIFTAQRRDDKQSRPTGLLAIQHVQLVPEGEVLQFQNRSAMESTANKRHYESHKSEHAATLRRSIPKLQTFRWFRSFQ
jgi:hypothetical protein